jgi:hypothetical protein
MEGSAPAQQLRSGVLGRASVSAAVAPARRVAVGAVVTSIPKRMVVHTAAPAPPHRAPSMGGQSQAQPLRSGRLSPASAHTTIAPKRPIVVEAVVTSKPKRMGAHTVAARAHHPGRSGLVVCNSTIQPSGRLDRLTLSPPSLVPAQAPVYSASRPKCCWPSCVKPVAKGPCPKHGGPKQTCEYEHYRLNKIRLQPAGSCGG